MMMFMLNFSELYPCEICRSGLKDIVAKSPPEVESRRAFTQWMCRVHNEVNVHLGKEVFDCAKVGTIESFVTTRTKLYLPSPIF